ncbi:MAG: VOC family protein [Pseudomonadota bacterium]
MENLETHSLETNGLETTSHRMTRRALLAAGPGAATAGIAAVQSQTARAETTDTSPANAIGLTGYDHMSINVADFDAAVAWYSEILGLTIETSWTVPALGGKQLAYLTLHGARVVEIVAADPNGTGLRAETTFSQHFGRTGFGHLCFATNDVDQTLARLAERGVTSFVTAETYPLDGTNYERRVGFVQDPEGNVIEFGEPLRRVGQ